MQRLPGILALIAFTALASGQGRRPHTPAAQVPKLEAVLKANPKDREARRALLDYYYNGRVDPAVAIPAAATHPVVDRKYSWR